MILKEIVRKSPFLNRIGRDLQLWFAKGSIEPELRLLPFIVRRDQIAIDVGANAGIYTHALTRITSAVVAIEADPSLAAELERNFSGRVRVLNFAASDRSGMTDLRVPRYGEQRRGLGTIAPENILGGMEVVAINVKMQRIDDFFDASQKVGFIKVDVEGHELAVLRGAQGILERDRPNLLIEAAENNRIGAVASIWNWLQLQGYVGFMLDGGCITAIEHFDLDRHQRALRLGSDIRESSHAERSDSVYNFVFVAR